LDARRGGERCSIERACVRVRSRAIAVATRERAKEARGALAARVLIFRCGYRVHAAIVTLRYFKRQRRIDNREKGKNIGPSSDISGLSGVCSCDGT